jgi:hypothetical protein
LGTVPVVVGVIAAVVATVVATAVVCNVRAGVIAWVVWAVTTMGGGALDTACVFVVAGRRTADVGVMDAGGP